MQCTEQQMGSNFEHSHSNCDLSARSPQQLPQCWTQNVNNLRVMNRVFIMFTFLFGALFSYGVCFLCFCCDQFISCASLCCVLFFSIILSVSCHAHLHLFSFTIQPPVSSLITSLSPLILSALTHLQSGIVVSYPQISFVFLSFFCCHSTFFSFCFLQISEF